jgi:hypothetical protein
MEMEETPFLKDNRRHWGASRGSATYIIGERHGSPRHTTSLGSVMGVRGIHHWGASRESAAYIIGERHVSPRHTSLGSLTGVRGIHHRGASRETAAYIIGEPHGSPRHTSLGSLTGKGFSPDGNPFTENAGNRFASSIYYKLTVRRYLDQKPLEFSNTLALLCR